MMLTQPDIPLSQQWRSNYMTPKTEQFFRRQSAVNIWQSISLGCALTFGLAPPVFAQSDPPPSQSDSEIVVNPTIAECNVGWENSAKLKWSKDQFEQFCAIQKSPAPIVANPTFEECKGGWNAAVRWTKGQFDTLCELLKKPDYAP